jgi:hypothetical protein
MGGAVTTMGIAASAPEAARWPTETFTMEHWLAAARASRAPGSKDDVQTTLALLGVVAEGTPRATFFSLDVLRPLQPGAAPEARLMWRGHSTEGPALVHCLRVASATVLSEREALLVTHTMDGRAWSDARVTRLADGSLLAVIGRGHQPPTLLGAAARAAAPPFQACGVPELDALAGVLAPPPPA